MSVPVFEDSQFSVVDPSNGVTTLSRPSTLNTNDVLVAHVFVARATDDLSFTSEPSGWTPVLAKGFATGSGIGWAYVKRVTDPGSEPSTYTWNWTAGNTGIQSGGVISRWSNCRTTSDPWDSTGTMGSDATSDTAYGVPAYTTINNDCVVIAGVATRTQTSVTWGGGYSEIYDNNTANPIIISGGYQAVPTSGTVIAATSATATVADENSGGTLALVGAVDAPSEALRPVSGGATTNFETYDHTKIDADPDTTPVTDAGLSPVVDP